MRRWSFTRSEWFGVIASCDTWHGLVRAGRSQAAENLATMGLDANRPITWEYKNGLYCLQQDESGEGPPDEETEAAQRLALATDLIRGWRRDKTFSELVDRLATIEGALTG